MNMPSRLSTRPKWSGVLTRECSTLNVALSLLVFGLSYSLIYLTTHCSRDSFNLISVDDKAIHNEHGGGAAAMAQVARGGGAANLQTTTAAAAAAGGGGDDRCAQQRNAAIDRSAENNVSLEVFPLYLKNMQHFLPNFLLQRGAYDDELWERAKKAEKGALFVGARSGSSSMCNDGGDFFVRADADRYKHWTFHWTDTRDFEGFCQTSHETAILKQYALNWSAIDDADAVSAFVMRDPLQRMISSYMYRRANEPRTIQHVIAAETSFVEYCHFFRNFLLTHMSPFKRCLQHSNDFFAGTETVLTEEGVDLSPTRLWAFIACQWTATEEERVAALNWWLSDDRLLRYFTVIGTIEERSDFVKALYVARGGTSTLWGRPHDPHHAEVYDPEYLRTLNLDPSKEPHFALPSRNKTEYKGKIQPLCAPGHYNARHDDAAELDDDVESDEPSAAEQAQCRSYLHLDYKLYEAVQCIATQQKAALAKRFPQIAAQTVKKCYDNNHDDYIFSRF